MAQAKSLLRTWFPNGRLSGKEYKVGSINGEPGKSFSVNVTTGEWAEFNGLGQKGGDLTSLYAAKFHDDDQRRAGLALGELLGVFDGEPQPKQGNGHANAGIWEPLVPPPASAPPPAAHEVAKCDVLFEYTGPDDQVWFYVRRHEARNGRRKQFVPLVYGALNGKRGWHARHPRPPRPLYGLNRLCTMPDAQVIVCEGEKAADAAQRLFASCACISWPGGSSADHLADWAPLTGRAVIIWPDADEGGRAAALRIGKRLPHARLVDVDNLTDGFDAADLEQQGCDDPEKWLRARLPAHDDPYIGLVESLSARSWISREMPPSDRLLGDLLTTTSRMFLVGRTGLGKTMLGLAMAMGMAFGTGFLHWQSARPARVLYFDAEMPGELLQQRIHDEARRIGREDRLDNLLIYSTEQAEDLATRFPTLGTIEPLNTESGQNFIRALCAIVQPDAVVFDNVQALLAGVQKEEECWTPTLPLVMWLTHQRIGQLWLDHTGHVSDRQYGSSTKSWRFDAVGIMTPLAAEQLLPHETAFLLSFDHPGKARRRTPQNWTEFAPHIIRLRNGHWTSEPADGPGCGKGKVSPSRKLFHDALLDAIAHLGTRPGETTKTAWESECLRRGLIEPFEPGDTGRDRSSKRNQFRKAQSELLAAKWIGIDGDRVMDLSRGYS